MTDDRAMAATTDAEMPDAEMPNAEMPDAEMPEDKAAASVAGEADVEEPAGQRGNAGARMRVLIRQPLTLLLLAVLITAGLGLAATRLQTDASASMLMNTNSAVYDEQAQFASLFGADPVVVLATPDKNQQFLTPNHMVGLAQLEAS